jgi:hypothetical protein
MVQGSIRCLQHIIKLYMRSFEWIWKDWIVQEPLVPQWRRLDDDRMGIIVRG